MRFAPTAWPLRKYHLLYVRSSFHRANTAPVHLSFHTDCHSDSTGWKVISNASFLLTLIYRGPLSTVDDQIVLSRLFRGGGYPHWKPSLSWCQPYSYDWEYLGYSKIRTENPLCPVHGVSLVHMTENTWLQQDPHWKPSLSCTWCQPCSYDWEYLVTARSALKTLSVLYMVSALFIWLRILGYSKIRTENPLCPVHGVSLVHMTENTWLQQDPHWKPSLSCTWCQPCSYDWEYLVTARSALKTLSVLYMVSALFIWLRILGYSKIRTENPLCPVHGVSLVHMTENTWLQQDPHWKPSLSCTWCQPCSYDWEYLVTARSALKTLSVLYMVSALFIWLRILGYSKIRTENPLCPVHGVSLVHMTENTWLQQDPHWKPSLSCTWCQPCSYDWEYLVTARSALKTLSVLYMVSALFIWLRILGYSKIRTENPLCPVHGVSLVHMTENTWLQQDPHWKPSLSCTWCQPCSYDWEYLVTARSALKTLSVLYMVSALFIWLRILGYSKIRTENPLCPVHGVSLVHMTENTWLQQDPHWKPSLSCTWCQPCSYDWEYLVTARSALKTLSVLYMVSALFIWLRILGYSKIRTENPLCPVHGVSLVHMTENTWLQQDPHWKPSLSCTWCQPCSYDWEYLVTARSALKTLSVLYMVSALFIWLRILGYSKIRTENPLCPVHGVSLVHMTENTWLQQDPHWKPSLSCTWCQPCSYDWEYLVTARSALKTLSVLYMVSALFIWLRILGYSKIRTENPLCPVHGVSLVHMTENTWLQQDPHWKPSLSCTWCQPCSYDWEYLVTARSALKTLSVLYMVSALFIWLRILGYSKIRTENPLCPVHGVSLVHMTENTWLQQDPHWKPSLSCTWCQPCSYDWEYLVTARSALKTLSVLYMVSALFIWLRILGYSKIRTENPLCPVHGVSLVHMTENTWLQQDPHWKPSLSCTWCQPCSYDWEYLVTARSALKTLSVLYMVSALFIWLRILGYSKIRTENPLCPVHGVSLVHMTENTWLQQDPHWKPSLSCTWCQPCSYDWEYLVTARSALKTLSVLYMVSALFIWLRILGYSKIRTENPLCPVHGVSLVHMTENTWLQQDPHWKPSLSCTWCQPCSYDWEYLVTARSALKTLSVLYMVSALFIWLRILGYSKIRTENPLCPVHGVSLVHMTENTWLQQDPHWKPSLSCTWCQPCSYDWEYLVTARSALKTLSVLYMVSALFIWLRILGYSKISLQQPRWMLTHPCTSRAQCFGTVAAPSAPKYHNSPLHNKVIKLVLSATVSRFGLAVRR